MSVIRTKAPVAARIFLGLIFTIFGLNGFFAFMPTPPLPEAAGSFLGALAAAGYMFPLIKGTEVVAGLMLLSGRFVPLSLVLLAPITVNILLFHVLLAPAPVLPLLLIAAQLYLAYSYRGVFSPILMKAAPLTESSNSGGQINAAQPVVSH